jgi:glycosyltransferase involved in cell wall biosynthesis
LSGSVRRKVGTDEFLLEAEVVRLLILVRSLHFGGAERQVVVLAKGLKAEGHRVSVVVLYPGGEFEGQLHEAGVPIASLDKQGRYGLLRVGARLLKVVRSERPDIIYSVLTAANLLSLIARIGAPCARLVWTLQASYVDFGKYEGWIRLTSSLEARLAKFGDRIIVNSQAGVEHALRRGYPADKLVVVRNGIDTDAFRPDLEGAGKVRADWNVGPLVKVVGLVGRIDPMKDHPAFLAAAALLAQRRADVRFACVGDGSDAYSSEMRELSVRRGLGDRICWAGLRSDMPAVYSALDVLVLCSRGEGLPNVVAEAMACGTPCVVTDVGDAAWVVDGLGVVVAPSAADVLADGIEKLLENPPDREGRETLRRRIVENLSVGRLIAETERVFREVLSEPRETDAPSSESR